MAVYDRFSSREIRQCSLPVTLNYITKASIVALYQKMRGLITMVITINQTTYEPLPTGEYLAIIDDIEFDEGKFGEQLKFRFSLLGEFEGRFLHGWTSTKFSPISKLYAWTKAALGGPPISKERRFESDQIVGNKVLLVIVQKQGENGMYNRIEDVKPFKSDSLGAGSDPF